MANKTPIRAVFNDAGTATGLSEFQSGDTLALTHGGLGASLSLGTAGQVLKVNSGASALEFGVVEAIVNIDNATNLTSATLAASDLFLVSDNGTEGRATLSQVDTLFTSTTQTLTNKSIDLDANTLTGTLTEFNSALQSESFVGLAATQTLTNKTLTSPTINTPTIATPSISAPTLTGVVTATGAVFAGASPLVFEGATSNAFETTFAITDPTADRTITLPNATGTIVLKDTTDTLTNKSIDSDNNTITNIVNADIKSSAAIAFSKMADLTASRALVSDGNGDVSVSAVTSTEIGYLDGVTSAIQTQLDNKSTKAFAIAQAVALG